MQNDIVTLITPIGEIVGRVKYIDDNIVTLKSPCTVMQTEQGAGFVNAVGLTVENVDEATFYISSLVAILYTSKGPAEAWIATTSGIVV